MSDSRKIKDLLKLPVLDFYTDKESFISNCNFTWRLNESFYVPDLKSWAELFNEKQKNVVRASFKGAGEGGFLVAGTRDLMIAIRLIYTDNCVTLVMMPKKGSKYLNLNPNKNPEDLQALQDLSLELVHMIEMSINPQGS